MEFLILCFIALTIIIAVAASPAAQARRQRIANERRLKKLKDLADAARCKITERAVRQSIGQIKKMVDAEVYKRRPHITPNTLSMYHTMAAKCRNTNNADELVKLFNLLLGQSMDNTETVLRKLLGSKTN